MHLKGKKAFVTGGTEGIGAAIVAQLVARGAEVVTCARHEPGQAPGPGVSFRRCDLTSAADREALIAWLVSTHPDLAVLVNNAAVQHALDFMQADVAQIQAATSLELALNLEAPIALSAGLLPLLVRQPPSSRRRSTVPPRQRCAPLRGRCAIRWKCLHPMCGYRK